MVAFRRPINIKDMVVRSSIRVPSAESPGFKPCKNCAACKHTHNSSVVEHTATSHTFSSHSSGQQFTIKHHLHCLSTNVVYLINCKKCGFQYIGETKRTLKTRLLEHCGDTKHKRDKPVARHFNQPNHTAEDILIMAIDRPSKNDTYHRLALESKWIEKLKIFHPFGINVKGHH